MAVLVLLFQLLAILVISVRVLVLLSLVQHIIFDDNDDIFDRSSTKSTPITQQLIIIYKYGSCTSVYVYLYHYLLWILIRQRSIIYQIGHHEVHCPCSYHEEEGQLTWACQMTLFQGHSYWHHDPLARLILIDEEFWWRNKV
jgi:hypothetical protein